MERIKAIAEKLSEDWKVRAPYETLSGKFAPADLAEAYVAQAAVQQKLAEQRGPIAGRKIALSSKAMQQMVGIDSPIGGAFFHRDIRVAELVRFREAHGHCDVPSGWIENPELANWVTGQRSRRGKVSADRVERLEALGFEWDPLAELWEARFSELVRFKEAHGHCRVPAKWSSNPELGRWVSRQKTSKKTGGLSNERQRRLEEIGFRF